MSVLEELSPSGTVKHGMKGKEQLGEVETKRKRCGAFSFFFVLSLTSSRKRVQKQTENGKVEGQEDGRPTERCQMGRGTTKKREMRSVEMKVLLCFDKKVFVFGLLHNNCTLSFLFSSFTVVVHSWSLTERLAS